MTRLPRPVRRPSGCAAAPDIVLTLMGLDDPLPARPASAPRTDRTEET